MKLILVLGGTIAPLFVLSFAGEIKDAPLKNIFIPLGIAIIVLSGIFYIFKKNMGITATEYNKYAFFGLFLSIIVLAFLIFLGVVDFSGFAQIMVIFLIIASVLFIPFYLTSNRKREKLLLDGENILLNLDGIKITAVNYLGAIAVMPLKKVLVTNKRILISSNMFGVETLTPAMRIYYKEPKNVVHDRLFFNLNYTLHECSVAKDALIIKFGTKNHNFLKYTIYAPDSKKIYSIIKKNSK